jgi:hypothetical protein
MHTTLPRRQFLACLSAAAVLPPSLAFADTAAEGAGPGPTHPHLFAQDPAAVREVVGMSHRDLDAVRALVDRQPALVNATIDHGFGDWESAIDAASHTGQVEIAQYLLSMGARPTIFTMAMLGKLEAVKALIEAIPGIQRTRGPHGITLLAHAEAGGEPAAATVAYLQGIEGANDVYPGPRLVMPDGAPYLGVYAFGPHETDRVEVVERSGRVVLQRTGGSFRFLFRVEDHTFHPTGAPAVRIRFAVENGIATSVSFADPDVYLTATRVPQ